MGARRRLIRVALAALAVCAWTACSDKGAGDKSAGKSSADKSESAADTDARCDQLAKACGDQTKHVEKLFDECKQAAKQQAAKQCTDKATAVYDCYEKELCGGSEKVWALDDFRVLSERHGKCGAERDALRACVGP